VRSRSLAYFAIGLVVGGVAGLIAGLLLAPDSGARTRRRIADEALRVADFAHAVAERAERAAAALGDRVDHYLGREEEVAWRKVRELREGVQRYSRTIMTP